MRTNLSQLLETSAMRHSHLCPRQVLGVRMGLAGAAALGLDPPCCGKRLLVILETDGCFADGVEVATGCTAGHRTLRIEDYGKVAATFVDVKTDDAIRLAPRPDVRSHALAYAPGEQRHYFAQLAGYQAMPEQEMFSMTPVVLGKSVAKLVSRPGVRVNCAACDEEIINEREVVVQGRTLCRACAWGGYYTPADAFGAGTSVARIGSQPAKARLAGTTLGIENVRPFPIASAAAGAPAHDRAGDVGG